MRVSSCGSVREVLREAQVVAHREMAHQMQGLQHDAYRRAAPAVERRALQASEVLPGDFHFAFARPHQAGEHVQERGLAAPGGPSTAQRSPWATRHSASRSAVDAP